MTEFCQSIGALDEELTKDFAGHFESRPLIERNVLGQIQPFWYTLSE